jgi:hypothetical protein
LAGGCSAPRDNPLDPRSELYVPPVEEPTPPEFWCRVRSVHISRSFLDTWRIEAELRVTAPDAADSAIVVYKQQDTTQLSFDALTATWGAGGTLNPTFFGDDHLETTPGFPFAFTAYAGSKGTFVLPAVAVVRVISGTPVVRAPMNDDTVGTTPLLQWEAFSGDFAFGYRVTMYTFEVEGGTTSWTTPLLRSTAAGYPVPDSLALALGDHYWTLAVVDSFENYSRSQEGWFFVRETGSQNE